jgi:hypothetical protein
MRVNKEWGEWRHSGHIAYHCYENGQLKYSDWDSVISQRKQSSRTVPLPIAPGKCGVSSRHATRRYVSCSHPVERIAPFQSKGTTSLYQLTRLWYFKQSNRVRFSVLTATSMKVALFWDVAPCYLTDIGDRPNDGGSKHLWIVCKYVQDCTVQHPRSQPPSQIKGDYQWAGKEWGQSGRGLYKDTTPAIV